MIHTAELTYFPDSSLIEAFKKLPGATWYKQEKIWYYGGLTDRGLRFRLKLVERNGFISPRLICRVNFSKLLHPADKITLMTAWDVADAERRFNEMVGEMSPLPPFRDWKVNRIDYCVNVHTPYVEQYIHLLKKGNRRYMQDWYDHHGNYTQKPGSLYYVATARHRKNRGVTVNFYNKADEMTKFGAWSADEDTEDLPKDILRLEIQCHKAKIDYLQKKYGLPDRCVTHFMDPQIAHDIISTYLQIIAGNSDYHRKSVALDMIDQTGCRRTTKDKLKQIIRDVAKQHSAVWKVRDNYVSSGIMQRDEFNALIRILHSQNINPVTIRDNQHVDGKTLKQGLKSVVEIFNEAFEEEMIMKG